MSIRALAINAILVTLATAGVSGSSIRPDDLTKRTLSEISSLAALKPLPTVVSQASVSARDKEALKHIDRAIAEAERQSLAVTMEQTNQILSGGRNADRLDRKALLDTQSLDLPAEARSRLEGRLDEGRELQTLLSGLIAPPSEIASPELRLKLERLDRGLSDLRRRLDERPRWSENLLSREEFDDLSARLARRIDELDGTLAALRRDMATRASQESLDRKPDSEEVRNLIGAVRSDLEGLGQLVGSVRASLGGAIARNEREIRWNEEVIGGKLSIIEERMSATFSDADVIVDRIESIQSPKPAFHAATVTDTVETENPLPAEQREKLCEEVCLQVSKRMGDTYVPWRFDHSKNATPGASVLRSRTFSACRVRVEPDPACIGEASCFSPRFSRTTEVTCVRTGS